MKEIRDGLSILLKYDPEGDACAQHDIIYAGPHHNNLAPLDLLELDKLGWFWHEDEDCWAKYT